MLNDRTLLNRCTQIKTYSWDNAQVVLVGNKCDLEDERVVSTERGKQLADQLGMYCMLLNKHVTDVGIMLVTLILLHIYCMSFEMVFMRHSCQLNLSLLRERAFSFRHYFPAFRNISYCSFFFI